MYLHHALRGALALASLSVVVGCGVANGPDLPPDARDPSDDDGATEPNGPKPRPPLGSRDDLGRPSAPSDGGDHPEPGAPDTDPDVPDPNAPDPNVPDPNRPEPELPPPVVDADPTAPMTDDGRPLPWPAAPRLDGVTVKPSRDSVTLFLPEVEGAADYRAFVLHDDIELEVTGDGKERVLDATVHCAGLEQHNAPAGPRTPARRLEVTGLSEGDRVVVEAIDTTCPFPGVVGAVATQVPVTNGALSAADRVPFSIYTEEDVRERYGSLIVNGHRPGPTLGAPADDRAPRVLARTTLRVALEDGPPRTSDFFTSFDDDADQPVYVGALPPHGRAPKAGQLHETSELTLTTYAEEHTQFFVDRGQLHVLLADWVQDVFASAVAYPKRTAVMDDDDYVHVTFEVPSNATARRYWWLSLCGASQPGQTLDEDGRLLGNIIQTPFFYQDDGKNPSVEKWSCFQLFPRDGLPTPLPPTGRRPESDLRVMVNVPNAGERDSVRNVSPRQYPGGTAPGWYRQMDASGGLVAPILDDQLYVSQKTRYDVYLRRDRVIVYVDGEQRLCNDFPSTPLQMAEAAVGFGQVLYHSAAERVEFSRSYNDRTGQRYYLENTPYIDVRAWDNLGFDDGVDAPAGFDESVCYVHPG